MRAGSSLKEATIGGWLKDQAVATNPARPGYGISAPLGLLDLQQPCLGLAALTWLALCTTAPSQGPPHPQTLSLHDSVSHSAASVRIGCSVRAPLVALIVAYRRQKVAEADSAHDRTRVFNERFTTIAAEPR